MKCEYTVAICDDSFEVRDIIKTLIFKNEFEKENSFNIIEFNSGDELLKSNAVFDILFLDIDMPGLNGIETAVQLNSGRINSDYRIIILSGLSGDWVKEAYKTRAIRYVSKPIIEEEFYDALRVATEELAPGVEIKVMSGHNRCTILSTEIMYVKAFGDYCRVVTKKEIYDKNCSLTELQKIIDNDAFLIPHRSYLVNFKQVKKIADNYLEMKCGERIPYSRRKKKEIMERFIRCKV